MDLSIEQIVAIAIPSAGTIVWLVRLEGQVKEIRALRKSDLIAIELQRAADLKLVAERRNADAQMIRMQFKVVNESLEEIKLSLKYVAEMQRKVDRISSFIGGGGGQLGGT
jgi:hypothetical protein